MPSERLPVGAGQWMGVLGGTNAGFALMNFDRHETSDGRVFFNDQNTALPRVSAPISFPGPSMPEMLQLRMEVLDIKTNALVSAQAFNAVNPGVVVPETAELAINPKSEKTIELKWSTSIGTLGEGVLQRVEPQDATEDVRDRRDMTWQEFRDFALDYEPGSTIFRGQPMPWRLTTSFHRTNRRDLTRYVASDLYSLHRVLSARTRHLFDFDKPLEYGAFLHLVQHHGYPTPLLDWTESPFVAAYFAFRRRRGQEDGKPVRVFAFDSRAYFSEVRQFSNIWDGSAHLSIFKSIYIENARAVPQQSLSTISTVADVQAWIDFQQDQLQRERPFLSCVDLPYSDRERALRDLRVMGITAGSMFPGLDGTCEELAQSAFANR